MLKMKHKGRPLVSDNGSHRISNSANDSTGYDLSEQTVKRPHGMNPGGISFRTKYNLELVADAENSFPEVDIIAVHQDVHEIHPTTDYADNRRQLSAFLKAKTTNEARESIAQSRQLSEEDSLASPFPHAHSFSGDTPHATAEQGETQEHQSKDRLSNIEVRASRRYSELLNISLLPDAEMFQSDIPNARIWEYSYHASDNDLPRAEYLIDIARNLIMQLSRIREANEYHNVPIIFIGLDHGGVVLQKMAALLDSLDEIEGKKEISTLTAGVLFLDVPPPLPPIENIKKLGDRNIKALQYRVSESSPLKEKYEHSTRSQHLLGDFLAVTERNMIFVVWFYCFLVRTSFALDTCGTYSDQHSRKCHTPKFVGSSSKNYNIKTGCPRFLAAEIQIIRDLLTK